MSWLYNCKHVSNQAINLYMPALSCHMEEGLVNFALFQKCAKL